MNTPDIDTLPAGPELDALIAEKVMGWEWNIRNGQCYAEHWCSNAADCWPEWSPSTDITAAWEVVEKLRNWPNGHYWLSLSQIAGVRGEWRSGFSYGGMAVNHSPKFVVADTAPLAICRAALKAITPSPF